MFLTKTVVTYINYKSYSQNSIWPIRKYKKKLNAHTHTYKELSTIHQQTNKNQHHSPDAFSNIQFLPYYFLFSSFATHICACGVSTICWYAYRIFDFLVCVHLFWLLLAIMVTPIFYCCFISFCFLFFFFAQQC